MNLASLRWFSLMVVVVGITACAVPPRTPAPPAEAPPASPVGDWRAAPGTDYALDSMLSHIAIRAYRAGRLAALGHNHVIEVADLHGALRRLNDGSGLADLHFAVDQLRVDTPEARVRAGDGFATVPGERAVIGTRRNMLSPDVLDAEQHPTVEIVARVPTLVAGTTNAVVTVKLRGASRSFTVPVTVAREGDRIAVSGSLSARQSAWGMSPFSALAGALRVRDALDIDFTIVGRK